MQAPNNFQSSFTAHYLSEYAVTLEFGEEISEDLLQKISRFNTAIHQYPFSGFQTTVPGYATISVFFDPVLVIRSGLPGQDCFTKVADYLTGLQQRAIDQDVKSGSLVTIPVCYGNIYGPDLDEVARVNQLTALQVIELHSSAVYKVFMIGFVPGFAYLGGMNSALANPRKLSPRPAIAPGSVGIAGKQTGVYPLQTPGGWQIIGQTPLKMFAATRAQPSLLSAGDEVVFKPISASEFKQYNTRA
ncbi:5-oxoprolinase subunit PxpB [Mucilaginibacter galii]|uniref:Kinase A inhibitor n=1 Tax=Mucilaginibacter galii TaxID=2005073 RepID=A0A917N4G7_9SPHI|nr:5-oxoprolinase subunit PxpB [Mucilaginibacter galii]GGI52102.1 kinase A inhibitor [Mucilaginibacter galii]